MDRNPRRRRLGERGLEAEKRSIHPYGLFKLAGSVGSFYAHVVMTRPQIEFCIKIFIVLLIIAFFGAATHVLRELGWV